MSEVEMLLTGVKIDRYECTVHIVFENYRKLAIAGSMLVREYNGHDQRFLNIQITERPRTEINEIDRHLPGSAIIFFSPRPDQL